MNQPHKGALIFVGILALMACIFVAGFYYVKSASGPAPPELGPLPETTAESLDELFNAEANLRVRQLDDLKLIGMRYLADPGDESLIKSYCRDMESENVLETRKLALTGYLPPDDKRKAVAERTMYDPRTAQEKEAAQKSKLASELEDEAQAELVKLRTMGFRASLTCK